MQLLPVHTDLLHSGDDLAQAIIDEGLELGDIIVVSSKAIATIEARAIDLSKIKPTAEAEMWAKRCGRTPAFRQAVLDEAQRMHGRVLESPSQVMLTELRPDGLPRGVILAANAGLDESNVDAGFAIGWPRDPVGSVRRLRRECEKMLMRTQKIQKTQKAQRKESFRSSESSGSSGSCRLAVILSDSCCLPRRTGVIAIALAVSGIHPLRSLIGTKDLFGKELRMTQEAVADQLATAANAVMGNAAQSIPAVIIRGHGIPFADFEGWVLGIEPEKDLFQGIL